VESFKVGLIAQHGNTPRDQEAREQLAEVLEDAEVGPIEDETGTFEVELEADSQDIATQRVIDAIAAAGVDDHIQLAEHTPPGALSD
jgi:hypothetical protein